MTVPAKSDPGWEVSMALDELPQAAPHPRRMLDRYEVIAQIAKGGMGTVYLARREGAGGFERLSAIKILHEHLAEDDTFVTMLLDEARTAAHIHHPNAVGIDDVSESPVGHYLVMGYVDGFNLAQIMTEPSLSERDRIRICTRLIVDAANGLHAAHTAKNVKGEKLGIVHRDVSPQNVLVGTDGMGRIVDFGIALAASRIAASRPGTLKGKPQYMAPEQARGEPCDPRTDVFALGVVLWEALTLERLFYGELDVAILVQVMDCIVPDPRERNPNAPEALAAVTLKALSKKMSDRYATAREFAAAIEKAGAGGWIASTAEVEETLARVFGAEIALKEEAVRRHLAASTGAVEPLQKGQLGLVPRLLPKKLQPKRAELGTRVSGKSGEVPSGVRERSDEQIAPSASPAGISAPVPGPPRPEATAETVASARIAAPGTPPVSGTTPIVTAAPDAPRAARLGMALVVLGLVALMVAGAVWASSGSEPVASPLPPTAAPVPSAVAPVPSVAPPTSVVAAPSDPAPPTAVAPAPVSDVVAPTVATDDGEHHHHHGTHVAPPTTGASAPPPTTTTTAPPPPPSSTGADSMTIETNPYLTH